MGEKNHTPGPYYVVPDPGQDCPECGNEIGESWMVAWKSLSGGYVGLATVMADDREEANARLFAAAPELLAACELALSRPTVVRGEGQWAMLNPADLDAIRAAVAKAKANPPPERSHTPDPEDDR
jgi:hypothetical protein